MKKIALVVVFISLQSVFGQKYDFFDFKSKAGLNICEVRDSLNSIKLVNTLLAMPSDSFIFHKKEYYQELSMAYYNMYRYTSDSNYFRKALIEMKKALTIDPYDTYSLPNIVLLHYFLKDYSQANYYLNIYLLLETKNRKLDRVSIKSIRKKSK